MYRRGETLVARWAVALLIPAIVLSAVDVASIGRLAPTVLALDIVAVILLPFGLLSVVLAMFESGEDSDTDDGGDGGGGGGGGGWNPPEELDPTGGGFAIDWQRFETDFRAYADSATLVG